MLLVQPYICAWPSMTQVSKLVSGRVGYLQGGVDRYFTQHDAWGCIIMSHWWAAIWSQVVPSSDINMTLSSCSHKLWMAQVILSDVSSHGDDRIIINRIRRSSPQMWMDGDGSIPDILCLPVLPLGTVKTAVPLHYRKCSSYRVGLFMACLS